jgi:tRNA(Ile)-lysidine synthase
MGPPAAVAAVRLAVRRSLAHVEAGDLVLVACSGGADSLALAAATAFEAPRLRDGGVRAGAITIDHGLQAGSAERAVSVAAVLRDLQLEPVEIATVVSADGAGPEDAARRARYAALDEAASRLRASAVLLGHTRDDQAETVLLGLARGSGARSLAGMSPRSTGRHGGRYLRPLLDLPRQVTRAACAAADLVPWDDPHNEDAVFMRTRVRREALPALERALGPGVPDALARTAGLLRDDADALDAWASRAFEAVATDDGLDCAALAELPAAVRTRVLRLAALAAGCLPGTLAAVHVHAMDELVTDWHGQVRIELPAGRSAVRRYGRLVVQPPLER